MKVALRRALWITLGGIVFFQMYFVRELFAVFLMISVVFAAFAILVAVLNGMHAAFQFVFARAENFASDSFSRKPFRRLRSLTAR